MSVIEACAHLAGPVTYELLIHGQRPGPRRTITFGGEVLERSWALCQACGIRLEWARVVGKAASRPTARSLR